MDALDNKYQIEQLLGQGGMGAVYRTTHLGTMRTVAVKVIHPQLSAYDHFEALDIPRSKWQARMKSRWTNTHSPASKHNV
ncbi:MAG TPA: hypothetical protein VHS05_12710 [Pyrinomonadaceae bacterium]|jgi:serine/threonine protein kinase|nr:hypothetical protein [Pyrinomonadaceae bacterium]